MTAPARPGRSRRGASRPGPHRPGRWVLAVVAGALVLAVVLVGGTAVRVWQLGRVDQRDPADVIVVLGAAQYDGRPSPILEARLEHAKNLYDQHVAPHVITVGGSESGDPYSEAGAGATWLARHGVPASAVLPVAQGRDTYQSFGAVGQIARDHGWHSAVLVSDPWHSLRSRTMAADVGLDPTTSPTHLGPIVRTRDTQFRYIVRETGALLYYRLVHGASDFSDTGLQ